MYQCLVKSESTFYHVQNPQYSINCNYAYKNVTSQDLKIVADIHKKCFPDHYLGKFSKKLIFKFYAEFLNKEGIIFIEHCTNIGMDGFVMGGVSSAINAAETLFIKK